MSRYIRDIKLSQPIDVVSMIMEDYVYHSRFIRNDWNGEMVYYLKDNHGRERYLEWRYVDGVFHVEAWLKSKFGNELGLDSFGGGASKREFKRSLEQLIATLKRQSPNTISSGHVGSDPLHHTNDHAAEHRMQQQGKQMSFGTMPSGNGQSNAYGQRTTNRTSATYKPATDKKKNSAGSPMVMAALALVFSSFPFLGIVFAVIGLRKCKNNETGNTNGTARLLCILAIVVSILSMLTAL